MSGDPSKVNALARLREAAEADEVPVEPFWAIGDTSGRLTLYVDNAQVAEVWKADGMWHAAPLEPWGGEGSEYWTESGALDAVIEGGEGRGVTVPKCPVELRTEKPPYPLPTGST